MTATLALIFALGGSAIAGCGGSKQEGPNPKLLSHAEWEKVSDGQVALLSKAATCLGQGGNGSEFDRATFDAVSAMIAAYRKNPAAVLAPFDPPFIRAQLKGAKAREAKDAATSPKLREVLYTAVKSVTNCGETEEAKRLRDALAAGQ